MFARKIRVEYEDKGERLNASVFDDTLPVADGVMEIGARVPIDQLQAAMEDWFRRKNYLAKGSGLFLSQMG